MGPRGRTMPLRWRMLALLAVLAGLVVANAGLTLAFDARLDDQARQERSLHVTARAAERLARSLDGQVVEVRGFALTGDPAFLRGYGIQRLDEMLYVDRLRRLLRGDAQLLARLDRLEASILLWRERTADPIIDAVRAGREQEAARVEATVDQPLFAAVRADAALLSRGIGARLDTIRAAVERSRALLDRQLLVNAVLAVLLVAGSAWALRRWITDPVAQLSAQVRRVAGGRLQEPVQGTGPLEFERLGEDVERMRRRIVADLEETQRAVEALEQNAPLVTSLRSQLRATGGAGLPDAVRVVGRLEPAHGVLAGDWYDVLSLDGHRVVLMVVDVCGHGPQAGLRALWLKHLLVPALEMGLDPGEALNWVAGQMGDTGEWFATCVIVEVDAGTGHCRYANAGHPAPLLFGPEGVVELPATGTLFGPLPGQHWHTETAELSARQMLVVYTDGITETRNAAGDEFGDARLVACFGSADGRDLGAVADDVMETVHAFGPERLRDDVTLAVVTCAPAEGAGAA
jgi:CHASE3 domain sensor protein